jgi:hypothetical protein
MSNISATVASSAPHFLVSLVTWYEAHKTVFSKWIGIDDWLLHAQSGMLIFLAMAILTRRPLSAWLPIVSVVIAELINEWFDRLNYGSWRWEDTSRDLIFTLGWPIILFLCMRTGLVRRFD